MPIHCVQVLSRAGVVLFTRHFDDADEDSQAEWEAKVAELTADSWVSCFETEFVEKDGDKYIVTRGVSDVILIATGSDEMDALSRKCVRVCVRECVPR